MSMNNVESFLKEYLTERPLFLSLIRAKEAYLFQKYLPLKKPVLDVGCGDGMFAKISFANKSKNNDHIIDTGLDLKESRIEEAGKLHIYKKLVTYDGRKIPFAENSFSTVVSNCVLEHAEDIESVLSEIYRVLKPGGVFVTTVMAQPWEEHLFGSLLMGNSYKEWMRKKQLHLNLFPYTKWNETFKQAGFKIKQSEGYLSPASCRLIDLCHYLSLPSLLSYTLVRKWILFPQITSLYPIGFWGKILSQKVSREDSGALFYVLKK